MDDRCLFCLHKRQGLAGKEKWHSSLVLESYNGSQDNPKFKEFRVTICKDCRQNKALRVKDIYDRIPEALKGKDKLKPFQKLVQQNDAKNKIGWSTTLPQVTGHESDEIHRKS